MSASHRAAILLGLFGLLTCGCSSYDPAALARGEAFEQLAASHGGRVVGHRVLVLPPVPPAPEPFPEDDAARAPMRLDAQALGEELVAALEVVLAGDEGVKVVLADSAGAVSQAWDTGDFDLVLRPRVLRWDAVFVDTNGWWYPNALLLGWYLWPVGQWLIADEVYGVDCELEIELVGVASERPLPGLADRRVVVRSAADDGERLGDADVVAAPRLALDDLDRGIDLFGTWFPGDVAPEQWQRLEAILEPHARRVSAVRVAAAAATELGQASPQAVARALAATHAVVVGVSAYERPAPHAAADAEAFARLLQGPRPAGPRGDDVGAGVTAPPAAPWAPAKNVAPLLNTQATRARVRQALARVAARAGPDDTLVFYFAGRGTRDPDAEGLASLRLLAHPGGAEDSIALTELAAWIRRVPAQRRIVVLDAGFDEGIRGSAGAGGAPPAALAAALRRAFLDGAEGGGVVLASSLGPDEVVQVWEEAGLLTRHLIGGLEGAADPGRDGLTWADLARFLELHVVHLSEVALPHPQRPLVVALDPAEGIR